MLALVNSSTRVRPVSLPVQPFVPIAPSQEICLGVPSCSPLVQLELLRAVREQMPEAYTRVWCDLGLTVSRTQDLIDRRIEIVSAARAIKLARMIAYEPNARDVFGEAGRKIFEEICRRWPSGKMIIHHLPRPLRIRMAMAWMQNVAHNFAGSVNQIVFEKCASGSRTESRFSLSVRHGVFADRLDTLGVAHEYYGRVFQTMFHELARVDCELTEVRKPRVRLDQCNYEIVWEA